MKKTIEKNDQTELVEAFSEFKDLKNIDRASMMSILEDVFKNMLKKKSFVFAVRIIKLHHYLTNKKEYTLSKQLLRSGTAIGALIREAQNAESKLDLYIS